MRDKKVEFNTFSSTEIQFWIRRQDYKTVSRKKLPQKATKLPEYIAAIERKRDAKSQPSVGRVRRKYRIKTQCGSKW